MRTAGDILREKGGHIYTVTPDTTIHGALQVMVNNKIGSILIEERGEFVGIWTERDLMRNSIHEGFDPNNEKIGDHMTSGPLKSAPHSDIAYRLLDKFLGMKVRHLLIEEEGKYIGVLSVGDVVKAALTDKADELDKLNAAVKWDYYENWKWQHKHK